MTVSCWILVICLSIELLSNCHLTILYTEKIIPIIIKTKIINKINFFVFNLFFVLGLYTYVFKLFSSTSWYSSSFFSSKISNISIVLSSSISNTSILDGVISWISNTSISFTLSLSKFNTSISLLSSKSNTSILFFLLISLSNSSKKWSISILKISNGSLSLEFKISPDFYSFYLFILGIICLSIKFIITLNIIYDKTVKDNTTNNIYGVIVAR